MRNVAVLSAIFLIAVTLPLSGCSGASLAPPTTRPMFKPNASVPAELPVKGVKTTANALTPLPGAVPANAPVMDLGLALADEVSKNAKNPFLNKLPEIKAAPAEGENPVASGEMIVEAPPPADPFEGVKLSGIVYNPKTPIALLAFSADNTQFAKRGDVVASDKGSLKVVKITRETVELVDSTNPSNKRTFSLPNIVGYASEKAPKADEVTEETEPDSPENMLKDVLQQKEALKQKVNMLMPPMPMAAQGLKGILKNTGMKLQQP